MDNPQSNNYFSHESSFVDDGAKVGNNTKIWHFSHVMGGAVIGDHCNIGQNVLIHSTVTVGNHVKIQNNVSLYDGVILDDYAFCGPSCVFTNIFNPRSSVTRNEEKHWRKTHVKMGATIGANATIVCGVTIGKHAFIGAGAVVTKDVCDYALVYGNPAKQNGWMCECGEKLHFINDEANCTECKKSYLNKNNNVTKKDNNHEN